MAKESTEQWRLKKVETFETWALLKWKALFEYQIEHKSFE